MNIVEYNWEINNKKIYGAVFEPEMDPQKVLVFIHGIGEHIRRYDNWFEKFCKEKFVVIGADHHGHGQSEGKNGHFKNYDEVMNFTDHLVSYAKEKYPTLPIVLYGHSMGGNISLNYLLRRQPSIQKAIISAPWLGLVNDPGKLVKGFAKLTSHIIPGLTVHSGIKRNQLTSSSDELEKYDKDNYIHGKISMSTFTMLNSAANYAVNNIKLLKVPTLFLHGTGDPITNYNTTKEVAIKAGDMAQYKLFDGFLHEIHKEKENHKVFEVISTWLS